MGGWGDEEGGEGRKGAERRMKRSRTEGGRRGRAGQATRGRQAVGEEEEQGVVLVHSDLMVR